MDDLSHPGTYCCSRRKGLDWPMISSRTLSWRYSMVPLPVHKISQEANCVAVPSRSCPTTFTLPVHQNQSGSILCSCPITFTLPVHKNPAYAQNVPSRLPCLCTKSVRKHNVQLSHHVYLACAQKSVRKLTV